ncbi:MAG TPA: alanine--tRNA ligase [Kofleriaceae bacterium]|nr:alanine--tRNA ligase [Kofleriaceae bacterium]
MTRTITSTELRRLFQRFFVEKGHARLPSASLVPANDPTVLFTTAGMHPLVPYLLGEPHPAGTRLVNVQKCVRTGDIDAIGDDTHLTFFEMLGNWSLGDYFRDDAIAWSFELLTGSQWLGLPLDRLAVTCFAGDDEVPRDSASAERWTALGVPAERIAFLGRDDNWWGPAGQTGPCGPDTEMFYWVGDAPAPRAFEPRDPRWVEIWNDVFMGYTKTASGDIEPLPRANVDTGMGLERTLVALGGLRSVYEVDTVAPLYGELERAATTSTKSSERDLRVLTDHARATMFMLADGVVPSTKDRGSIARRLLRRCFLAARRLGMPRDWHVPAVGTLATVFDGVYPELGRHADTIRRVIDDERERFDRAVGQGTKLVRTIAKLDGKIAFDLFQTHGIPFELTLELAEEQGTTIDREDFNTELERHRALSRTTSSGAFSGGLADHSDAIIRYHTLTHLLHAALREVLGDHVIQRGSNITHDRLRFDFSHDRALSTDELDRVQAIVNGWLARDLVVKRATMPQDEARALGAIGAFGDKYGDTVSVYTIVDRETGDVVSREFCGGPHVQQIRSDLAGQFRIAREHGIAAGIRRIRAVLELR